MQAEMMAGGSALWFDLFVAMVEHLVSTINGHTILHSILTRFAGRRFQRQGKALSINDEHCLHTCALLLGDVFNPEFVFMMYVRYA